MKKLATFLLLVSFLLSCSGGQKAVNGTAWMFKYIERLDEYNPLMEPDSRSEYYCPVRKKRVNWEEKSVFNPTAVLKDSRVWMLYRAQDKFGTSRIGIANSRNGTEFRRNPVPVLHPDNDTMKDFEWEGGCEDPRIVRRDDGLYVMTYTAYDKKFARLCLASSRDLINWEKHGVVLTDRKYREFWSKSGAIVCERDGSQITAKKVKGKYWMYWGDTDLFMASSDDLLSWRPMEDKKGKLTRVMMPRPGLFDSRLVEPGPFALIKKEGIVLLYNSANSASSGDKSLGADAYSVGQALFSAKDPSKLLARSDKYLLTAERDFEQVGEVANVCFLEGMVWVNGRWLLYYGAGDSKIAVAEMKE
ncbi:MAG: glycosidase [Phycisphaerae bacterium]|nr:glycosidase [Saprospiraceae bacterium]